MRHRLGLGRRGSQTGRPFSVLVPGMVGALLAIAASVYMVLIVGQGLGHFLGRIFVVVPSFVAILAFACAAGALTRGLIQRVALLGMAAAGLGALGVVWIWINLFTLETAVLLLIAAALATFALVGSVMGDRRRLPASLAAATGACLALLILGVGLGISIAPTCGAAGGSVHIDNWHQPWSAAYACGDGRLSFEFWPKP